MSDPRPLPKLSPKDTARFWAKVTKRGPRQCWPWTGACLPNGDGVFKVKAGDGVYRQVRSARVAYLLGHGADPGPKRVVRRCHHQGCCNPGHLFLGTRAQAIRGGGPGAKLTEVQVRQIRRLAAAGVRRPELARRFGVSRSTIDNTVARRVWARVP